MRSISPADAAAAFRPWIAPAVIVISYGMWKQDLGGAPNVIGHDILLDGKPVTVVGVMPASFSFPTAFGAYIPARVAGAQG